uniref:RAB15, member RAS oncogene family n=1 Tax=Eptatretus burgeri TaxID=7764 RepID=A0A8C4R3F5_EPTBU
MAKQYDVLFRLLLLGDSGVGKTCLLCRFTDDEFHPSHISTIGIDFKMKTIDINGIKVRIQLWDTAGQERYQTITKQYYRRAQFAPKGVEKVLIGNKMDKEAERQIAKSQGQQLAQEYRMAFFEASAYTSQNVKEAFTKLTELVLKTHRVEIDSYALSSSDELSTSDNEQEVVKESEWTENRHPCWC